MHNQIANDINIPRQPILHFINKKLIKVETTDSFKLYGKLDNGLHDMVVEVDKTHI